MESDKLNTIIAKLEALERRFQALEAEAAARAAAAVSQFTDYSNASPTITFRSFHVNDTYCFLPN